MNLKTLKLLQKSLKKTPLVSEITLKLRIFGGGAKIWRKRYNKIR